MNEQEAAQRVISLLRTGRPNEGRRAIAILQAHASSGDAWAQGVLLHLRRGLDASGGWFLPGVLGLGSSALGGIVPAALGIWAGSIATTPAYWGAVIPPALMLGMFLGGLALAEAHPELMPRTSALLKRSKMTIIPTT